MIKLSGLSDEEVKQIIPDNTILLGWRGSIAHGTYQPKMDEKELDDKDLLGVCLGSFDTYFGLQHFEQKQIEYRKEEIIWDSVVYELRKMANLLLGCNPNVMSLLWLEPQHYIFKTELGERLIKNRNLFVSKRAYHSFNGYAYGQFKRMTHFKTDGQMGAKRKMLVEKFGYDTKNASHLVRILRMGIEFLREGELHVLRADGPQLLEIKNGKYTLEKVKELAEDLFKRAEAAYDESKLPNNPDYEAVNKLVTEIVWESFNDRR